MTAGSGLSARNAASTASLSMLDEQVNGKAARTGRREIGAVDGDDRNG